MSVKHLSSCMNSTLSKLMQQVTVYSSLDTMIAAFLAPELKAHCFISGWVDGCLTLGVDDPVWATLLRYQLGELRTFLRQQQGLYQLTSIHIKLQPGLCEGKRFPSSSVQRHLSKVARETIQQASQMTSFEPLSQALQNLAKEDF